MYLYLVDLKFVFGVMSVEQAWCGIYGMAPTIQAQHVVAVTIPTIAVLFFTYLWYKKRSNSITRNRNDPGGGGGTSRKRTRHRNNNSAAANALLTGAGSSNSSITSNNSNSSVSIATAHVESREILPEAMKNAMQKVIRDLETASPIQEICSDSEENQSQESENSSSLLVVSSESTHREEVISNSETRKSAVSVSESIAHGDTNVESDDSNEGCESGANTVVVDEESTKKAVVEANVGCSAGPCESECGVGEKRTNSESEKSSSKLANSNNNSSSSTCCTVSRQFDCKISTKNQESWSRANGGVDDNLDVAMLKLESMRMSDSKSKRNKQNGGNAKRQSHLAKDNCNLISSSSSNNDASNAASRAKSPPSALSQLASSPPSKARKRKSRKRLKSSQCGNTNDDGGDGVGNACKSPGGEITTETATTTTASKVATCDSNNKNIDTCGSRTTIKDTKHTTTRKWTSDSEKTYSSSHENDRLSCNLKESSQDCDLKVIENHPKDCDNERDSANHSPVDTILDCQSVQFSDAHSEGSSDSGKGCSEGAVSPSPQTPAGGSSISGDQNAILWYQFVIPQEHVGKLIGKLGQFINTIKAKSNTRIFIKKHPTSFKKKICALEGTQPDINKALELIRIRFPEETYPDLTLEEFPLAHQPIVCPLRPELFQLDLVEGVNNDVVISSVVTAGHLFLQQPMHPTYQSLTLLNINMNQVYNSPEAPLVLKPAKDNIVAAPAMGGWYRAQITAVDEESETCDVRFLDYGGYLTLNTTCLRAVRADFLTLPFQAVECFLANIAPMNETWSEDAKFIVQSLTYGQILQAQVYDYTSEGIPLVLLYAVHGSQVILINDELVARGFAYHVPNDGAQSEDYYVYS